MKRLVWIGILFLLALTACDGTTREARRMVKCAEQLADTLPDSAARLIDSVLRMPASFSERERMDMALLQAEALFGCRDGARTVSNDTLGVDACTISPIMDDDFFDEHAYISTSPELERAAAYYAKKKQYAKAAHAALYSGFVQQHYDEKEAAMRSFKEAEQYGKMVNDSLTVARAEYWMGRMLYYEGRVLDAIALLKDSDHGFEHHIIEKAIVKNMMAVCHLVLGNYEDAELCLQQSLMYAGKKHFNKIGRKALNNYAVLYQLQGEYDSAIKCLRSVANKPNLGHSDLLLYVNLCDVFAELHEFDSAAVYFRRIDSLLPNAQVKNETKVTAYILLSKFAESQDNDSLALFYRKQYEEWLNKVRVEREQNYVYGIQQKYDYGAIQNTMSQRIIRRQRLAIILSIVVVLALMAFVISQIRLSKIRKQEAEIKACLLRFMKQNKALVESNKEKDLKVLDATQQLSDLLYAKLMAMQKLDYCLKTPKDKIALKDLEKEVFGGGDHWEAVKEALEVLYPGLWETIGLKYPDMDEMERRVCMLSHLKLSRLDEATLLGISTSVLDKLRTKVRKTLVQDKTNS